MKDYNHFDWSTVPHELLWFVGYGKPDERRCVLVGVQEDSLSPTGDVRYYVMVDGIQYGEKLAVVILGHDLFPTRREAIEALLMRNRRDVAALQAQITKIEKALTDPEFWT
jgi:hypothetical protein